MILMALAILFGQHFERHTHLPIHVPTTTMDLQEIMHETKIYDNIITRKLVGILSNNLLLSGQLRTCQQVMNNSLVATCEYDNILTSF